MALFPQSLDEIDFWDLDMFTDGDPHLAWSLLRREAPVWLHDRDGTAPFWCLTRYEDVHAVLADPQGFSSRDGVTLNNEAAELPVHMKSKALLDDTGRAGDHGQPSERVKRPGQRPFLGAGAAIGAAMERRC